MLRPQPVIGLVPHQLELRAEPKAKERPYTDENRSVAQVLYVRVGA